MAPRRRSWRSGVALPFALLSALHAAIPARAQPAPAPRQALEAKPLSVKSAPSATVGSAAASPPSPVLPAPASSAAPPRLSEAPPDRLSPLCRTAALKLLQQRRKKGELGAADRQEQEDFRAMHLDCFNATGASLTAGPADIGGEILRSVAQVVLERAQGAAWRLLQEKLREAAGCGGSAPERGTGQFPATCATLRSLPISDLVSSPAVLLNAVIADFLPLARPGESRPWMRIPILEEALTEATIRWSQTGSSGMNSAFAHVFRRRIKEQVAKPDCELAVSAPDKALWVSGMCLIEAQAPASFSKCDVEGWASQCTDPVTTARILRLWFIVSKLYGAPGRPDPSDHVDLICTSADIAVDESKDLTDAQREEAHAYVSAMKAVLGGLAHKDWIETTSGAVRVLRLVSESPPCAGTRETVDCDQGRSAEKLFTLLAALGNYAETFTGDAKGAGEAREKILRDLADRMVNRAHRDSGWVVSAGGNLGLLGGARTDLSTGAQVAFPAQLGLGVGLQSYGRGNHGFHAMVTAIDLGQYITFSGSSLEVDPPLLESSVTLGLTAGAWLALRETPFYVGAYGGISPFVKAQDRPTYQLGLVTGIYVPLLDFN